MTFYLDTSDYLALDVIKLLNNPARDIIRVRLDKNYDSILLSLYTITGQKIQELQLSNPSDIVSMNINVTSGLYLLHISNGEKQVVKKVIVQ